MCTDHQLTSSPLIITPQQIESSASLLAIATTRHQLLRDIHAGLITHFGRVDIEGQQDEEEKKQQTRQKSSSSRLFDAQLQLTSSSSQLTSSAGITESLIATACVEQPHHHHHASSLIMHLLITNSSRDSIPTPAGVMSLRLTLAFVRSSDTSHPADSELSFSIPFPSSRWHASSRIHLPVALDSHLLDAHRVHVRVALCVEAEGEEEKNGEGEERRGV